VHRKIKENLTRTNLIGLKVRAAVATVGPIANDNYGTTAFAAQSGRSEN